jgi:hypothetical protein
VNADRSGWHRDAVAKRVHEDARRRVRGRSSAR